MTRSRDPASVTRGREIVFGIADSPAKVPNGRGLRIGGVASVCRRVLASLPGTFLRVEEFAVSCDPAVAELRQMEQEAELVEVRSGLLAGE